MNERLKIIRLKLKLNQQDMGSKIGVTNATISRLEKRVNNFTERMIISICREFNVNEDWFRYGTGEIFTPNINSNLDTLAIKYSFTELKLNHRLKYIRNHFKLNQDEFGRKINVTRSHVSALEKSKRTITDRIINDICREFNVNEDWLRYGTGEIFAQIDNTNLGKLATEYNFTELEFAFFNSYLKLDTKTRSTIINFLEDVIMQCPKLFNNKIYDEK